MPSSRRSGRWRGSGGVRSAAAGRERRELVDAAFSYEGAADEASFVLGPALVGVVGAILNPSAAILAAAVLLLLFGTWFAVHPTAGLVGAAGATERAAAARLLTPALLLLALVQLSVGIVFGSVQTGTSVLATAAGEPGLTGLFHALLGVGSVAAGLAVVAVPETFAYERRLRVFTAALALLTLPLLAVDGLGLLAVVLLVLGLAVAPTMITTFTVAERITDVRRLGAAMTVLAATTGLGYAVGSSVAGRLADWGGHRPAFAVTVAAGLLALTLALTGARTVRRAQARSAVRPPERASAGSVPSVPA